MAEGEKRSPAAAELLGQWGRWVLNQHLHKYVTKHYCVEGYEVEVKDAME